MGALGEIGEILTIFRFLFIPPFLSNAPTGQTADHIFMLNGSNDVDPGKDVPFLASVDIASHLGDQIAPKLQFLGREKGFSSQTCKILKCSYYKNYCIDHNQILQSDRDPLVLTVGCPNMPQTNPRISSQPIDRF